MVAVRSSGFWNLTNTWRCSLEYTTLHDPHFVLLFFSLVTVNLCQIALYINTFCIVLCYILSFVVKEVALVQVFSKRSSVPCQSFHRLLHTYQSGRVQRAVYLADVPSRVSLTQQEEIT
jgi:hypothetical protein